MRRATFETGLILLDSHNYETGLFIGPISAHGGKMALICKVVLK